MDIAASPAWPYNTAWCDIL